ncbi:ATP-binding protein [Streptomyces sp. NPDC006134]|uniref:ATP-binding protein n=1 Tax=Streptomyces sp. NPDC006134 TaxID=3154467 RepID=UPI0033FB35D6
MDLVRREQQIALLERLLDDVVRGEARGVRVTGGSGTGKSALLDALARRAGDRGALVLTARACPAEARLPLGVAGQLLSAVPGGGAEAAPDDPAALHAPLRDLAAGRPVVVLVDDAQHTDEASARCLLYLCGRLASAGILLALADARWPPHTPPLAELLGHPRLVPVVPARRTRRTTAWRSGPNASWRRSSTPTRPRPVPPPSCARCCTRGRHRGPAGGAN